MSKLTTTDEEALYGRVAEIIEAACYQLYLPSEEELRAELAREREQVEHRLGLGGGAVGEDGERGEG